MAERIAYTTREVADMLGVDDQTIRSSGTIPAIRISPQRVIYPKERFHRWLNQEVEEAVEIVQKLENGRLDPDSLTPEGIAEAVLRIEQAMGTMRRSLESLRGCLPSASEGLRVVK